MLSSVITLVTAGFLVAGPGAIGAEPDVLAVGYTLTGRVLADPNGKPVAGVLVTLWDGSNGGRWTARTDERGAYSFRDIKPGDYYKVWIEERPNKETGTWSEAVVVRVKDRPAQADDLFVTLPQSLSGTVTDAETGKPVAGAEINFSTADRDRNGLKTDSNGRYRLFVVPRDVEPSCHGTDDRYEEAKQRHQVAVDAGKHVRDIDFKVKSSPPFTGRVVLPDGKPAKGAEVCVELRWTPSISAGGFSGVGCGRDYRLTTDDEGRFHGYMRGVLGQGGAKTVDLKVIARTPDHRMGGVTQGATTAKDDFRMKALKVELARSAGFLVRVVDPDGNPVLNSRVTAADYPGNDDGLGGPVKHVGNGKYLMTGLVPGLKYRVSATTPGFRTGAHSEAFVLKPDEIREIEDIRLEWWGKKAVPGLVKKLQSPDMYDRETAAALLGELGAEAVEAVPALVEKLKKDPRNTVRYGVAAALGKIGPAAKASVPDLVKALQEDTGGGVQREAATALGLIGDLSAVPVLKEFLAHTDRDVRQAAAEALKRLDEAAKKRPVDQ